MQIVKEVQKINIKKPLNNLTSPLYTTSTAFKKYRRFFARL